MSDHPHDHPSDDRPHPSFPRFLDDWNALQDQSTPVHHRRIAEWLERGLFRRERALLLMAFRGAGKSTIVGLFCAWLLLTDPNRRVLVVAADLKLAKKMVRSVMRTVERHPGTKALVPPTRRNWGAGEFTVERPRELRDPSMLAQGIAGNVTGNRADVVICDDVEVPRTSDTAPKRGDLRERLGEIEYVLVPGGLQLYVGTPHSYYSIYADEPRPEMGETHAFLEGFDRLVLPVWDDDRVPAWPERFDQDHIERIRKRSGAAKFATQMMLRPMSLNAGRLDPDRLRSYDGELDYREAMGRAVLTLNGEPLVSASCWWDPAFARPGEDGRPAGDGSVVAAVFAAGDGRLFIHRVLYLATDPADPLPEARQQCRAVAAFLRDFHLPAVHVETNGVGGFLPGLLAEALRQARVACAVVAKSSHAQKERRIVEAFDARLAAGSLHAHRSVFDTPFLREMREWRPGGRGRHLDDGLDAVAGAIACEPFRFEPAPPAPAPARPNWRPGVVQAATEWEV